MIGSRVCCNLISDIFATSNKSLAAEQWTRWNKKDLGEKYDTIIIAWILTSEEGIVKNSKKPGNKRRKYWNLK